MRKLADAAGDSKVSDENEISVFYKKNPDKFKNPEKLEHLTF